MLHGWLGFPIFELSHFFTAAAAADVAAAAAMMLSVSLNSRFKMANDLEGERARKERDRETYHEDFFSHPSGSF